MDKEKIGFCGNGKLINRIIFFDNNRIIIHYILI